MSGGWPFGSPPVERTCAFDRCGATYMVGNARSPQRYCTRTCASRAATARRTAERKAERVRLGPLSFRREDQLTVNCPQCGGSFRTTNTHQRYCNLSCSGQAIANATRFRQEVAS